MDPFDELLRGVRTDGSGLLKRELSPPWDLRFGRDADLTLLAPLDGQGWYVPDADGDRPGGGPRPLRPGDILVARGGTGRVLTDRPADGSGEPSTGPATLVVGTYQASTEVARRLLRVLPPLVVLSGGDGCSYALDFLAAQADGVPSGRQVVQDRVLDWLLVCTLRGWLDQPDGLPPGWLGALSDDTVGPVLRAMHTAPERPWTLAALASLAGVSRTTLAERFARLVGRPPLTYLTDWRMALAADLLTGSTATVGSVARQVGYADAFGFSSAFKRVHGASPSAYRHAGGTTGDAEAVTGTVRGTVTGPGREAVGTAVREAVTGRGRKAVVGGTERESV
ncbi:AraC family transcriptional regulator [Streptomyces sp. JNUCC 64]